MTAVLPASVAVLGLVEPLPGFPEHRDYVLVGADNDGLVFWLQSMAPDGPRFLAVPPAVYFPGYAPVLPVTVCAELGLEDPADAQLFCLLTVPDGDVSAVSGAGRRA